MEEAPMNLTMRKCLALSLLGLAAISLSGCSGGDSSAYVTSPLTIRYYDDVGGYIGHTYAMPGSDASLPSHLDDGSFDYRPRTNAVPLSPGGEGYPAVDTPMKYVFSGFAGEYENGDPVDPKNVLEDCSLRAVYTLAPFTYSSFLKNGNKTVLRQERLSFPSLLDLPTEGKPDGVHVFEDDTLGWFETDDYVGYALLGQTKDDLGNDIVVPAAKTIAGEEEIHYVAADSAPTHEKGLIWFDSRPDAGEFTFPAHYSDGSDWFDLGTLSDGLPNLNFRVVYTDTAYVQFPLTVYGSEKDAVAGTNPLNEGDLNITYLNGIEASAPVLNGLTYDVTFTPEADGGPIVVSGLEFEMENWALLYDGNGDPSGRIETADNNAFASILDQGRLFPIQKCRIHLYESEAKFALGDEYIEHFYGNLSGAVTFTKLGGAVELTSSVSSARLRIAGWDNVTGFKVFRDLAGTDEVSFDEIVGECYAYPQFGA